MMCLICSDEIADSLKSLCAKVCEGLKMKILLRVEILSLMVMTLLTPKMLDVIMSQISIK